MSALSVSQPFPIFTDTDGSPLENGYVWIGTVNQPAQTSAINVYWDAALTIQATQPIRTTGGYPSRNGSPARLYVNSDYSILVQNKNGSMVYSAPDGATDRLSAAQITYFPAGTGAVPTTVQAKLREFAVSVKDFGAVGDGIANDRDAINDAFAAVISRGYGTVFFPFGTYYISDFIGNTDFSGNTQPVSIGVDADLGTVISCNPAVFANTALFLRFIDLQYARVQNLTVNCNDKTSTGIFVTGQNNTKAVLIDNCQVNNCFGIDNAGATTSVFGIYASSELGDFCSITNCRATNIRRAKQTLACQAIVATGWIATNVSNNIIFNVRHDGTALQDADGIVVISYLDGSNRFYRPSVATIANNRIIDCEGRFIKLQTHGSALVEGNTMTINGALELIVNFQFIDSQVAQTTIINNKFEAGDAWTGGASATVASLQTPNAAVNPLLQTNEPFVQKFCDNEIYIRKKFPYGVLMTPFRANVASKNVAEVCGNMVFRDRTMASADSAVALFISFQSITPVADVTGQTIWTIADNQVSADIFIGLGSSLTRADYTDKWWMYVYNNVKFGTFNFLIRNTGASPYDFPYTSNVMIRDNQMGESPQQTSDLFGAPINSAKLINGSDFSTGDGSAGVISPAPANWNNGHFGRKGGVLFAETVAGGAAYRYISRDNGANWYQV